MRDVSYNQGYQGYAIPKALTQLISECVIPPMKYTKTTLFPPFPLDPWLLIAYIQG